MILSYRFRLKPSHGQRRALKKILNAQRWLYNRLLEDIENGWKQYPAMLIAAERKNCPAMREKAEGFKKQFLKDTSFFGMCSSLTIIRGEEPEAFANLPVQLQRWTVHKLATAQSSFLKRLKKKNGRAGPPRFKNEERFRSFGFREFSGVRLVDGKSKSEKMLLFKGMPGGLRVKLHRPLPEGAEILSCVITAGAEAYEISFQIRATKEAINAAATAASGFKKEAKTDGTTARPRGIKLSRKTNPKKLGPQKGQPRRPRIVPYEKLPAGPRIEEPVGGDWGLYALMVFSDGTVIPNPRIGRAHEPRITALAETLSRCKRGSNRRAKVKKALRAAFERRSNARDTFAHQLTADVVAHYPRLAIEDLKIKNMTGSAKGTVDKPGTNVKQKAGLNREMLDASPARLSSYLDCKAGRAGGEVRKVDPKGTSIECSRCHSKVAKELEDRVHECPHCGLRMNRDLNAAINIRDRGWPPAGIVAA